MRTTAFSLFLQLLADYAATAFDPVLLESTYQADDAVDVYPGINLELTFNQPVVAGPDSIEIRRSADDALLSKKKSPAST